MLQPRIVVCLPIGVVVSIKSKTSRWRNNFRMVIPENFIGFPVFNHFPKELFIFPKDFFKVNEHNSLKIR